MRKILIIDDDPGIQKLLKKQFEINQYTVISALDGFEGIEKLDDERPDMIILDILMTGLNGHNFVKVIKQYEEFRSIPIIVLTQKEDLAHLFDAGDISAYMVKPCDTQKLLEKIKELFANTGSK